MSRPGRAVYTPRHGAGAGGGTEDAGRRGERLRPTPPPVARAAPDEPARPRRGGGDLVAPPELHRDRTGRAEPGDGRAHRPGAGRAAEGPEGPPHVGQQTPDL